MSVSGTKVNIQTRSPVVVTTRPTYQPLFFNKFHTSAKDVLSKNFKYSHELLVSARSAGGLFQQYSIAASSPTTPSTELLATLTANYSGPSLDIDTTYYSNPAVGDKITIRPKKDFLPLPVGAKLELTSSTRDDSYGYKGLNQAIDLSYTANYISATTKVLTDLSTHTVDASVVLGLPAGDDGVGIGVQAKGKNSAVGTSIDTVEAGLHYKSKDFSAALVTSNYLSSIVGSWTQLITPYTTLAAQFTAPLQTTTATNQQRVLTLGTSHAINPDTTINLKTVIPDGSISFYAQHRSGALNNTQSWIHQTLPKGTFAIALQTSGKKSAGGLGVASIDKYGISYTLGEY